MRIWRIKGLIYLDKYLLHMKPRLQSIVTSTNYRLFTACKQALEQALVGLSYNRLEYHEKTYSNDSLKDV
jgi:hypothetical protein